MQADQHLDALQIVDGEALEAPGLVHEFYRRRGAVAGDADDRVGRDPGPLPRAELDPAFGRSEEHTSELQSLMRISYAVFCLKNKKKTTIEHDTHIQTQ